MNPEVKGRFIALLNAKFITIMIVLVVAVTLLVRGYINSNGFAAIVTSGIFAHNITNNVAEYESYAQKALGKGADTIVGEDERDDKMAD